jgi:hypothetical protein
MSFWPLKNSSASSMLRFAFQVHVGEELHFHHLFALALAGLAAPALHVETEVFGLETADFGQLLPREQVADEVVGLDVGDRVGAAALPDGALVDELHAGHFFQGPF